MLNFYLFISILLIYLCIYLYILVTGLDFICEICLPCRFYFYIFNSDFPAVKGQHSLVVNPELERSCT